MCDFPHFLSDGAMDTICPDQDVSVIRRAIRGFDDDSIFGHINRLDTLAGEDFLLVLDVIVQYLKYHLTIQKCDWIAMSG